MINTPMHIWQRIGDNTQMIRTVGFLQKLTTIDDVTKYHGIPVSWYFLRRYIIVGHFLIPRIPRTTWVNRHQRGKLFSILLEQEMMGWQWHQLDHMQIICTSLQTDNHASTSPLRFFRLDALPAAQPTVSKQGRHIENAFSCPQDGGL